MKKILESIQLKNKVNKYKSSMLKLRLRGRGSGYLEGKNGKGNLIFNKSYT